MKALGAFSSSIAMGVWLCFLVQLVLLGNEDRAALGVWMDWLIYHLGKALDCDGILVYQGHDECVHHYGRATWP